MFARSLCLCCGGEKKQKMRRKKIRLFMHKFSTERIFFEKCIFASAEANLNSVLWFMMRVFEVLIIKFRGDATRAKKKRWTHRLKSPGEIFLSFADAFHALPLTSPLLVSHSAAFCAINEPRERISRGDKGVMGRCSRVFENFAKV